MQWKSAFVSEQSDSCSGSAQIVEFSWVFPAAAMTVAALMLLSFLLFFYVYGFHLVEQTADETLHAAQEKISFSAEEKLREEIRRISFIPGLRLEPQATGGTPREKIIVRIKWSYLGKNLFTVEAERNYFDPIAFAEQMDNLEFMKRMCLS